MTKLNEIERRIRRIFRGSEMPQVTFFEVKELYNRAYEQKAQARNALRRYRKMMAQAEVMDRAYRAQLPDYRNAA